MYIKGFPNFDDNACISQITIFQNNIEETYKN